MRGIARLRGSAEQRVRRWDVMIVGAALPGLVAAVRLGQRGHRVVVLEEGVSARAPLLLREPFALFGADAAGVLGSCLRTLGVPLIDQRRFAAVDVAVQVVLPDARVDFGRAALTAAELIGWGLAKPDEARAMLRALEDAAAAERVAMQLDDERPARRRGRSGDSSASAPTHARGWPREAAEVDAPLRLLLDALTRALSNLGESAPSPEARARLIGGLLAGGAVLAGGDPNLVSIIRRRAHTLFAEFRSIDRSFELVSVANLPGIALRDPDEVVTGRVMVLNAPLAGLRRALRSDTEVPELLAGPEPTRKRVLRHLHGPAEVLPEGMEARLVCVPATSGADAPVVTLRRQPGERPGEVDLVAAAIAPLEAPLAGMQEWIDRVLERLIPFGAGRLAARPVPDPVWDTDALLCDPSGGGGWPAQFPSRLPGRLPIHHLDRTRVAGLGAEGDLMLGLRAADAIAAELS